MRSLKCFLDIHLEAFSRHLDILDCFPYQAVLQFSVDTSWIACDLTQFGHCLLGGNVRSHRVRTQSCNIVSASDPSCKSVPLTNHGSLLGFHHLLEPFRKLRKTFTYQFIIKDIKRIQMNSQMKKYTGRGLGGS